MIRNMRDNDDIMKLSSSRWSMLPFLRNSKLNNINMALQLFPPAFCALIAATSNWSVARRFFKSGPRQNLYILKNLRFMFSRRWCNALHWSEGSCWRENWHASPQLNLTSWLTLPNEMTCKGLRDFYVILFVICSWYDFSSSVKNDLDFRGVSYKVWPAESCIWARFEKNVFHKKYVLFFKFSLIATSALDSPRFQKTNFQSYQNSSRSISTW